MNKDKGISKLSISQVRRKKLDDQPSKPQVVQDQPTRKSPRKQRREEEERVKINPKSVEERIDSYIKQEDIEDGEVKISDYLEIAFHYKYMIIISVIACFLAALAYSSKQIPLYQATSKIFIQEDLMELQIINNKPMFKQSFDLKTWIQIIQSSEISKRTSEYLSNRLTPNQIANAISCSVGRDEEHIISISAQSIRKKETAEIANAVFHAIVDYDNNVRSSGFSNSLTYLESQAEKKQAEFDELEQKIEDFYKKHNIVKFTEDMDANLGKVDKFREMLTTAQVELSSVKANIKGIKSKLESEDNDIVAQTTYSEPLKIRLMNLEVDLARALTKYSDQHPKIIAIQQNIDNVKQLIIDGAGEKIQLRNMTSNPVRQQLINDLIVKQGSEIALEQKVIALKEIIKNSDISPEFRGELSRFLRDKNSIATIIQNLQNQMNDIKLNANIESNRIYQLQEASEPNSPINNKKKMNLMIGIVLGFGLGIGAALLLHSLDNRLKSIKDFTSKFNLPLVGTIPDLHFSPLDILKINLKAENLGIINDVFKHICLNFRYLILDRDNKAFAIASPTKGEGKSAIALNMAQALANDHQKVVLIDTDFHIPRISRTINSDEQMGLSEILSGQIEIEECIQTIEPNNFAFIPSGKKPPNIPRMLNSKAFTDFVNEMKKRYDIVLFDTPATLMVTETSYLYSHLDGVILVVKILKTNYSDIRKMIRRMITTNTEILGAVVNGSKNSIFDKEFGEYGSYYYKNKYKYNYYTDNKPRVITKILSKLKGLIHKLPARKSSSFQFENDEKFVSSRPERSFFKSLKKSIKNAFIFDPGDDDDS